MTKQHSRTSNAARIALYGLAAAGASLWLTRRSGRLDSALKGSRETWVWRDHEINYAVNGSGPPLLLLHAPYPGASNGQWEMNFEHLTRHFQVFAPDLLGFGLSDRPPLSYTPELYQDLIRDFLCEVVRAPTIVTAAGQTAPMVIKIAAEKPDLVSRLILDTPTGLTRFSKPASRGQRLAYAFWSMPIAGTLGYFAAVSKAFIKRQLHVQALNDPELSTTSYIDNLYNQAHQPGAKWAPIAMFGGRFNCDASAAYRSLKQPTLVIWGEDAGYIPVTDAQAFVESNSRTELHVFGDCRLMPEYEHCSRFNNLVENWALARRTA